MSESYMTLQKRAVKLGMTLTRPRPFRWEGMTVRYILKDELGEMFYANLSDVARKLRRVPRDCN